MSLLKDGYAPSFFGVLFCFWHILQGTIAVSWSRVISNYMKNRHIDIYSAYKNLHSHQQWSNVPLILKGVKWNLKVVWICIYLMIKDPEHFFKCFSAFCISSLENSVYICAPFWNWLIFISTFLSSTLVLY